jgi:hypothetical protein
MTPIDAMAQMRGGPFRPMQIRSPKSAGGRSVLVGSLAKKRGECLKITVALQDQNVTHGQSIEPLSGSSYRADYLGNTINEWARP